MAGGHGGFQPVRLDPAIERWTTMRENVYQTFKFTRKATAWIMFLGVAIPGGLALLSMRYDNKFDWAGKTRGTSLLRAAPASPAAASSDEE